ncbi:MAG: histidine kinase [Butyrivibrio sp.]|nr:histidine kinase [Butyrivibrio sp.]
MKNRSVFFPIILFINSMFVILAATYAFTIGGFFREEKAAFVLSRQQMVANYVNTAGSTFSSIDVHLSEIQTMLTKGESVARLRSRVSSERIIEGRRYYETLSQKAHTVEGIDIVFIMDTEGGVSVWAYGDNLPSEAKVNFREYIEKKAELISDPLSYEWQAGKLGDNEYYYKLYKANGFLAGVFCLEDHFAKELVISEDDIQTRSLKNLDGDAVFSFDKKEGSSENQKKASLQRMILVEKTIPGTGLMLSVGFKNNVLDYLRSVVLIIVIITGAAYLIIDYVFMKYLKKKLLNPISELSKGAEQIIDGNYNYTANENGEGEVLVLQKAFNNAIKSVVQLRIDTYEFALKQKEQELLRLRQQLKPHFYLNALAVVKGMAFQRKVDDIQQYIDTLTVHIRYLLNNDRTEISLQKEFDHVGNYVSMQRICFPGKITAFLDLEEKVKDTMIPYLLLHTIVENAFKHGRGNNSNLIFTLSAREVHEEDFDGVLIEYEDAGTGFDNEFLKRFEEDVFKEGDHFGLRNLKQTLNIYYGQKVKDPMKIMNVTPNGARIEIRIPAKEEPGRFDLN